MHMLKLVPLLSLLVFPGMICPAQPRTDEALDAVTHAVIHPSMGDIELEFYNQDAPKTVKNFITLAHRKYFDGVLFHRVINRFVMQGGDPTGTGDGGESIYGKTFEDEIDSTSALYRRGYKRGIVGMANDGPNTNGSQCFIMHADYPLKPRYTIFANVVGGMDTVDKICSTKTDPDDRPVEPVYIRKITLR